MSPVRRQHSTRIYHSFITSFTPRHTEPRQDIHIPRRKNFPRSVPVDLQSCIRDYVRKGVNYVIQRQSLIRRRVLALYAMSDHRPFTILLLQQ